MEHLGFLMKPSPNAMATVFSDHRKPRGFGVLLNRRPDITQMSPWGNGIDSLHEAFLRSGDKPLGKNRGLSDREHAARIPVKAVFNDGDVNIDDIAVFESFRSRDTMTYDMVNAGTDRPREPPVIQRGRDGIQSFYDVAMANLIDFSGRDTWSDMNPNHIKHLAGQFSSHPHADQVRSGFQLYWHR
jgi:hypothetical protein